MKKQIFGKEVDLTHIPKTGIKKRRLTIGLDIDDTLVYLMKEVAERCNEKFGSNYTIEDFRTWGFPHFPDEHKHLINDLFKDVDFYSQLKPMEGTKELITELDNRGHRIVIVSATFLESMSARALYIEKTFPEIARNNIVLTASKDLIELDILIDDKADNIFYSSARVPALVDQPWNQELKHNIRLHTISDYLDLVDLVEEGYSKQDIYRIQNPLYSKTKTPIVVITGGSASGKTTLANNLPTIDSRFKRVITTTTRKPRTGEQNGVDYNFCSKNQFESLKNEGKFVEFTEYIDNYYGLSKDEIKKVINEGKIPVVVLDKKGAESIRKIYGEDSILLFIKRPEGMIESILERDVDIQEKSKRINQLFSENLIIKSDIPGIFSFHVSKLYDYTILNENLETALESIRSLIK